MTAGSVVSKSADRRGDEGRSSVSVSARRRSSTGPLPTRVADSCRSAMCRSSRLGASTDHPGRSGPKRGSVPSPPWMRGTEAVIDDQVASGSLPTTKGNCGLCSSACETALPISTPVRSTSLNSTISSSGTRGARTNSGSTAN